MHIKTNTRVTTLLCLIIACFMISCNVGVESVSAYSASITTNSSVELDITPNGNGTSIIVNLSIFNQIVEVATTSLLLLQKEATFMMVETILKPHLLLP